MKQPIKLASAALLAAAVVTGCMKDNGKAPETPTIKAENGSTGVKPVVPIAKPATTPAAKAMTHVLSKAQPYFASMPKSDEKPAGTLPAGTKVLLVIPGPTYSQIETMDGMSVYTMTEGVDPIAMPGPAPVSPQIKRVPEVAPPTTKPLEKAASVTPPAKVMTHTLNKEEQYFMTMPTAAAAPPSGTMPAGTKVLLVIPGAPYSQVETTDGKTVYVMTDGLDSIPVAAPKH